MDARMKTSVAALVLLVLISYGGRGGEAQDCLPSLTPCASYLNTTGTPDKTCCDGLISVIDKDAKCLCGLLNNSAVKQLGINMTKALELPARCGKNVTADQCTKINSGAAPSATPTSGGTSSSSKPGSSSSSSPKGDSSGASSLVAALFSSVSLAALFSLGFASQMLMGGGGGGGL